MFNPLDYDLNTAYRNEKMATAQKAQSATEHTPERLPRFRALPVRSFMWIVALAIVFAGVFGFSAQSAYAQDTITDGGGNASDFDVNFIYLRNAIYAIHADDMDSARDYLGQALDRNANFAPAYASLAYIAILEEDAESALSLALTAYDIHPDAAITFVLAEAYFTNGDCVQASTYFNLYLTQLETQDYQPVLIVALLNADTLPHTQDRLAACETESLS